MRRILSFSNRMAWILTHGRFGAVAVIVIVFTKFNSEHFDEEVEKFETLGGTICSWTGFSHKNMHECGSLAVRVIDHRVTLLPS